MHFNLLYGMQHNVFLLLKHFSLILLTFTFLGYLWISFPTPWTWLLGIWSASFFMEGNGHRCSLLLNSNKENFRYLLLIASSCYCTTKCWSFFFFFCWNLILFSLEFPLKFHQAYLLKIQYSLFILLKFMANSL